MAGPDAALVGGSWGTKEEAPVEVAASCEVVASCEGEGAQAGTSRKERLGLAVRERLPMWVQARCGLERRAVVALVLVLGVAAVFAAQHFWTGRAQPVRPPDVVREAGADAERGAQPAPSPGPAVQAGRTSAGAGAAAGDAGAAGVIVVDVSGKVRKPGVHRLPAGSRVADALRAAGGVSPGTKTGDLNRARFLVDGEQVVVGGTSGVGAGSAGPGSGGSGTTGPGAAGPGAAGSGAAGTGAAGPIGLNTATAEQLDELPGVGPVLAQHILDYRAQHGGFRSVEELREVNGIGDRRFADLQGLVRP